MLSPLEAFFETVKNDPTLQEQLYRTKEISDVAEIANEAGFKCTGAEILWAQANRILTLPLQELEALTAGLRGESGAQWSREGKGYLDRAGFWLVECARWGHAHPDPDPQMTKFLSQVTNNRSLQQKIIDAKTFNEVASLATEAGFKISPVAALRYQVKYLLGLSPEAAELVSRGAGHRVA